MTNEYSQACTERDPDLRIDTNAKKHKHNQCHKDTHARAHKDARTHPRASA